MKRHVFTLAALGIFSGVAVTLFAADLNGEAATIANAIAKARPGEVIRLEPGQYGDVTVNRKKFEIPVRIVSDAAHPAVFNSLRVLNSEGLRFEGVTVAFEPISTTSEAQNVVSIEGSRRIAFTGGKINAGMAVNGVPESATTYDRYGNIIGWPLGRGVFVALSEDVEISDSDVSAVQRGIITYKSSQVRILRNHIHDVRRTFIAGDASDLTISKNQLQGTKPWRWGQTPIGDHGDCIALFPSNQGPMSRVYITDNSCKQNPGGAAILGFTLVGIRGLTVTGNVLTGTDHQGIVTSDVQDAVLTDNILNGRAGILLRDPTIRTIVSGNQSAFVEDRLKGASGNVIGPKRRSARD